MIKNNTGIGIQGVQCTENVKNTRNTVNISILELSWAEIYLPSINLRISNISKSYSHSDLILFKLYFKRSLKLDQIYLVHSQRKNTKILSMSFNEKRNEVMLSCVGKKCEMFLN